MKALAAERYRDAVEALGADYDFSDRIEAFATEYDEATKWHLANGVDRTAMGSITSALAAIFGRIQVRITIVAMTMTVMIAPAMTAPAESLPTEVLSSRHR